MKLILLSATVALVFSLQPTLAQNWQPATGPLMTRWAKDVSPTQVLAEYPRPQMRRNNWQNLNGLWDYAVTEKNAAPPAKFAGKILVPFPIEAPLSGVMKALTSRQALWYRRSFSLPATWKNERVLLHFGAVDWEVKCGVTKNLSARIAAATMSSVSPSASTCGRGIMKSSSKSTTPPMQQT